MPDVVILRGASGSGKTTFAKRMPRVRISRDDLRRLLFGIEGKTVLTPEQEKKVTKFQREWIERELLEGNDVVVDDTNLNKSLLKSLCRFINDIGFNFTIVDTKVSLEEARRGTLDVSLMTVCQSTSSTDSSSVPGGAT